MKITERIFDCSTNETVDVERELTDEELVIYKEREANRLAASAEAKAKAEAKAAAEAKLAALGLTADDLEALGL